MMKLRSGVGIALVGAGLVALSCNADRRSMALEASADASVSTTASVDTVVESRVASTRVAELRARFRLPVPVATRFESAAGADAATHMRAVLPSEALRGVTRAARVALPVRAGGEVKLEDETSHLAVRFALHNVQDARAEVAEGMALYRGALDGADVVHRVHAEGTEDFVVFETRPAREELTYSVDVSRVPGLRLVSNTLEFLDDTGTPLLRVAPPYVVDVRGERHEARLSVTSCAYDTNPTGPWGRAVTKPAAPRCDVHVTWAGDIAYPAMVDPAWNATGSMSTARGAHTASVLPSGKVLVAGGEGDVAPFYLASAELFDPAGNAGAGTFAATGGMTSARFAHTSSVLPSGKVLIVGGAANVSGAGLLSSAQLYDPATGQFTDTGSMPAPCRDHTASVLPSGNVLIAGGYDGSILARAFRYDPGTGQFSSTGSMASARYWHTATVLLSGKLLITGGRDNTAAALANAELYDPAGNGGAGAFSATGLMGAKRESHTASLLPSGKVLVAGGAGGANTVGYLASAELYDPAGNAGAGAFSATGSMAGPRTGHTASVLPSGKVLLATGLSGSNGLFSAELFDPAALGGAGAFTATASLAFARQSHTASVLLSGKVLVVGGQAAGATTVSAELYGRALAESCTVAGDCFSGFCADGVCCNAACSGGGCDRCDVPGKEGTCTVTASGAPGVNPACAFPLACDGVNAACPTSCASDAACAPAYYCAADGTCQSRKAQGAQCNPKAECKDPGCSECTSGFCVDGFCCDTACNGTCQACAAALTQSGGANGTCGPTKDGTDPRSQCAPAATLCGPDGMCNGTGACRLVTPAGVSCAPDGKVCDGSGSCAPPPGATCDGDHTTTGASGKQQDCAPYRCINDGTCRVACTSVADCVAPTICDATGRCAPPQDSASQGGCAVVAVGTMPDARGTGLLALLVVALVTRTRARRGAKGGDAMSARLRRAAGFALIGGGLVVLSCSSDRGGVATGASPEASVTGTTAERLAESPEAAARVAELVARFRLRAGAPEEHPPVPAQTAPAKRAVPATRPALGAPSATRFEIATEHHVRAVLPVEALRGVTRPARVALPLRASDEVTLADDRSDLVVRFALEHVHDARVEVAGGFALYRGALDGADVVHRVHAAGTEDFVVFESRPAREELSYSVDVSRVSGLRLVSNTLEFLDAAGTPLLRVAPPYVVDARGERHDATLSVNGCAYDTSPVGPWGRGVTRPGAERCTVRIAWPGTIPYPAMVDPAWGTTGTMVTARQNHTASKLPSGKVLIAGGVGSASNVLASAELYDPAGNGGAGTFAATGSMATARENHTASVLASGKVLVAGGEDVGNVYLASAELYDSAGNGGAGTFGTTGLMSAVRTRHTASALPSGKVLIAGGLAGAFLTSAELFDPAGNAGVGAFTDTGSMSTGRYAQTASALPSGKVLVAGGGGGPGGLGLTSAEIFDPKGNLGAGTFATTASMITPRLSHAASVLPSGEVLVAGGGTGDGAVANAELFNPAGNGGAGTFSATGSMAVTRVSYTATLLPSGMVLVAGGNSGAALGTAELFDRAANAGAGAFASTASLLYGRSWHTASLLPSGQVLLAGGDGAGAAELFGGVLGDRCTVNAYCFSGFCADGFCCNAGCSGSCDRCDLPGKEGTCSVASFATPGANPACVAYACDGVSAACPTSCTTDTGCAADSYCAPDATCQPRKAQAAACNSQTNCKSPPCRECASGNCVDGVCCDAACDGVCQACVAALTQFGTADGTCGPIKDGIDPRNGCAPSGVLCGADGMCNGTGRCRLTTPAGVSCSADGKVCDGSGGCALPAVSVCDGEHITTRPDGTHEDCAPYKCDSNGSCRAACTSVSDCVAPAACDSSGTCVALKDSGGAGGCAVGRGGVVSDVPGWAALLALSLAFARRRRSARRSEALS